MPKIIRGTRDAKGNLILRGGQGGVNKIRCPGCHGFAQPATVDGKPGYACATCGSKFRSQRM